MRKAHQCLVLLFLAIAATAHAASTVEVAARKQVDEWLAVVDQGQYGEAWAQCAPFFRLQIPREEFSKSLAQVRDPLGAVEKRELLKIFYATTLPDAPEAHYVIVQFKTKFAGRAEPAIEIVTPMLIDPEGDPVPVIEDPLAAAGQWQVAGYYIQ